VDLRDIGFGFASQRLKRLQPARDVFERHRLQFSAPLRKAPATLRQPPRPARDDTGSVHGRNR
jgi:hypothetical protein